jgi:2,3-bisphosphoglycerate-dependent phosphoglycerate mutase
MPQNKPNRPKTKKAKSPIRKIGKLIITRHHESTWNKQGRWTGLRDVPLTPYGFEKANDMGLLIKDINIDLAFASMKVRSIETLSCILFVCERHDVPTIHAPELNERDYGDYTGKNKWDMEKLVGPEEFTKIRRAWDYPPPNGESLKMVYERVIPYFKKYILPELNKGKNVIVVSHGNTCRALIKYIENISEKDIATVEMPFGIINIYDVDKNGSMTSREVRKIESETHKINA